MFLSSASSTLGKHLHWAAWGETPHQHPPGVSSSPAGAAWTVPAPGCFDPERSAPLAWDRGHMRRADGGVGKNLPHSAAPLPAVLRAAGSGMALPIPPANTHPAPRHGQASMLGHPKHSQGSGAPSQLLLASSPPRVQLHPAGLQPNHSCTQER